MAKLEKTITGNCNENFLGEEAFWDKLREIL